MKGIIEEYGKIIFATLALLVLLAFLLGNGAGSFLGLLSQTKPEATVGTQNSGETLEEYSKRMPPLLEVKTKKIEADTDVDLLSSVTLKKGQMKVTMEDGTTSISEVDLEEGKYKITITKIVDQDGNDMTLLDPEPTDGTYIYSFSRLPEPTNDDEMLIGKP